MLYPDFLLCNESVGRSCLVCRKPGLADCKIPVQAHAYRLGVESKQVQRFEAPKADEVIVEAVKPAKPAQSKATPKAPPQTKAVAQPTTAQPLAAMQQAIRSGRQRAPASPPSR